MDSIIGVNYDPLDQPDQSVKEIFSYWVRGNVHYLNHIRGFLARIILRPPWFRSALFISGPPRTGKSLFVNLVHLICGERAVILSEGHRAFDRALWKDARTIIMNDCSSLDRKTREIIRQLTGSDLITYEKKYVQVTRKQSFRFQGVFIIVSNMTKNELISNTGDTALAQRFVEIPFDHVPDDNRINPQLINHLRKHIGAIINWSLTVSQEVMRVQATAVRLDSEFSVFAYFIQGYLVKQKGSFVSSQRLMHEFEEFLESLGVSPKGIKIHYTSGFVNELSVTFQFYAPKTRKSQERGLSGIAFMKDLTFLSYSVLQKDSIYF